MIGALILGLIWIGLVQAVTIDMPEKFAAPETVKVKRYFTHEHPPCPPPSPDFHMPMQSIFLKQPYGPPDYSKQIYKLPAINHHPQIFHQASYTPWMMDQKISYVKPQVVQPLYHHEPIIHHIEPIHSNKLMPGQWQNSQKINYHMSPYTYAPTYHTAMAPNWSYQAAELSKQINYHVTEANLFKKPGIVYKKEKDCPPCHQVSQHQYDHHSIPAQQPIKPIIHGAEVHSASFYPSTVSILHSPLIKALGHADPCVT